MSLKTAGFLTHEGIEIYVDYYEEIVPEFEAEPGNPNTFVGQSVSYDLKNISIYFGKEPINILPLLSDAAKEEVIILVKQKSE